MERIGIERAPLMWRSRYSCHVLTSMMSAFSPRSSRSLSSSTPMYLTGASGGAAGAAPTRSRAAATMITSGRRTSAPDDLRPTAHRRSSVAELLRLHGLSLAAVRNRVEQEVGADGIHVHQVITAVGGDAAVSVEASQLAVLDLVDAPGRDAEVLAVLGGRRDGVAGDVVPVVDLADDGARVAITAGEDRVRHPDQRDHRGLGRLVMAVRRSAEERGRLAAVHEAAEDALGDVDHASRRRSLVIVAIVTVAGQARVGERRHQR